MGPPHTFDLAQLVRKIETGTVASAAVETQPNTPDPAVKLVLVQTTPAAKLREPFAPRSWRYDLAAAFGSEAVRELEAETIVDALVSFADEVVAKAGVIYWARTTSYASALAMGAGGGLTKEQETRIVDSHYWRSRWGRFIRGPAWGTFLSAEHVVSLGGIRRIEKTSGCARTVSLASGGAFLQLTSIGQPIPAEDEDDRIGELAKFLAPVIPRTD